MKLEPIKQQELIPALGVAKARRACLPTCFYILAKARGYIDDSTSLLDFVTSLDWQHDFSSKMGWFRAKVSTKLRAEYGMNIISWQLLQKGRPGFLARRRMKRAGYYSSRKEWRFFSQKVVGKTVFELVRGGYPVITSVLPGFDKNKDVHAVILAGYDGDKIKVIDPNADNGKSLYTEEMLHKSISPLGAASVVLPK